MKEEDIATTSVVAGTEINKIFEAFQMHLNPNINYGNTTQRKAISWMIEKYGLQKVVDLIKYAVLIKDEPYAPTITTPYQLKEKMAQLIAYWNKNNSKQQETKGITL